ncbi:MAG: amidophosphoribosyltransferase [Deltaproteobacteria bacterium]|nr:amidophosphoribosyltransferase [Deltaproteobacteria bacterium]
MNQSRRRHVSHELTDDVFDRFHEECGVVGIYGHPEAANLAYLALYALQHRGQESAGIASSNEQTLLVHRGMGLVADIFDEKMIRRLEGSSAIGHNRYSTAGTTVLKNSQPLVVKYTHGSLAIAHNGNLVNADDLRLRLETRGSIFQSTVDTEVILHLIAASRAPRLVDRIMEALWQVRGAYSLVFLSEDEMIAVRDPYGFRPLVLGRIHDSGKETFVVASETCAFDLIGAKYEREVEPGEVLLFSPEGLTTFSPFPHEPLSRCVFEHIYFARPDSLVYGRSVYQTRKEFGRQLAHEAPVEADLVIPVPDSGVPAALGYAEAARLPFDMGLIRNHYVGRTFIEPHESIRNFGVKVKLNAQLEILDGKRVVVVDDSIVRGTTSRKIVKMIRDAGAREVHLRISSPPTIGPCFYGVDTPTRRELIAASHTTEEICQYITADSLAYLSAPGMYAALKERLGGFCDACFTGRYPVPVGERPKGSQLPLFAEIER